MLNPPRHWHNFINLSAIGFGYWMASNLPPSWYVNLTGGGLIVAGFVWIVGNEIGMSADKIKEARSLSVIDRLQDERDRQAKERANPQPEKEALPPIRVDGVPLRAVAYTQTVEPVRLDHEQSLARTLVFQKNNGFPMNISESYWIREGHWKDGPESFRATRGKWEYYKIVGKRGSASNSRYQIENERAVELIASGSLKLPPPPL